jgi:hypothetical protein
LQEHASLEGDNLDLTATQARFLNQPFQLASELGADPLFSALTTYGDRHVTDNNNAEAEIHAVRCSS